MVDKPMPDRWFCLACGNSRPYSGMCYCGAETTDTPGWTPRATYLADCRRFYELRRIIPPMADGPEKTALIKEYMRLGQKHQLHPDGPPEGIEL
jgi:hypothetical protein